MPDLARFIERQHPDGQHAVDGWARAILAEDPDRATWSFVKRLNAAIRREFCYLRREEAGIQAPSDTLRLRAGSCRDFAVLLAEGLRTQGIAARFVSGYLQVRGGDEVVRQAGGSTHAWIQAYLPGGGWIDLDPTSGEVGNGELVRVAVVRDPAQASPVSGSFIGFPSDFIDMTVSVSVAGERPRRAETQRPAAAA
jgi:transglutaminase-like putative cysteine protease